MNTHRTRLWLKLVAIGLLVLYLIFFVGFNAGYKANVWLFFGWQIHQVSVVVVILVTAVLTVLTAWFGRRVYATLRQLSRSRR